MHSKLRPSPAMVVALIALFVALGGSAAALSGSNTVFTDDITDDTVAASGGNPAGGLVAADLRAGSVRGSEVLNSSLTGGDIANSSLTGDDIANGSLTSSETDPQVILNSNFSVVPFDWSANAGAASGFPAWDGTLRLGVDCRTSAGTLNGTFVSFINDSTSTATLNWLYGNGSSVSASGEVIGAGNAKNIGFFNGRVEGQFIYADDESRITVNLHAIDLGNRCEVYGTEVRGAF